MREWSGEDVFKALCIWTMVADIIALSVAVYTLNIVRKGPRFIKNGLLLIIASCLTDIVLELCIIFKENPSDVGQFFLYLVVGIGTFLDLWIYWSVSFMYWVTAQNMEEYFQVTQERANRISRQEYSGEASMEAKNARRNKIINWSYGAVLGLVILSWFIATIYENPNSGPNKFMRFLNQTTSSKIYVYFMIGILILRLIGAIFFAQALWKMYCSLNNIENLKDRVSGFTFIVHLCSMLFYIIGRLLDTFAFMKAAFTDEGYPVTFGSISDFIAEIAFLICYLAIIHICKKMFRSY